MSPKLSLLIVIAMILTACAAPTEIPVPSPTITATQLPTASPTLTSTPTSTPEPTAIPLDPNAWNEFGNVAIQNRNIAPFGKQLDVNPELEAQTAETIFRICNEYSYITAMASEFNKTRSDSALPHSKYQSFENFMRQVIQPAIDGGKTIEGYHLVGHDTLSNKPHRGMVEPLPSFDPSVCSIKIGGRGKVYSNSLIIGGDGYQIGMDIIEKDGKPIRELIINVSQGRKNGYGIFFANPEMPDEEMAMSFSQLLHTVEQQINNVAIAIPTSGSTRNEFLYAESKDMKIAFSFDLPGTGNLDLSLQWMSEAPNYFIPSTP